MPSNLGAFLVLLYLHWTLKPQVPEVERLLSWAWWGCVLTPLIQIFLQPKTQGDWRFEWSPPVIGAIAVIAAGIAVAIAYGCGLPLPWYFNMPWMALPLCLVAAWLAALFAIRNADQPTA